VGHSPAGADQVSAFAKPVPGQTAPIAVIKQVHRPRNRAGQIVQMMYDDGYPVFTIARHTELWQSEKAKGFAVPVFGEKDDWGWYDSWVVFVREYCAEQAERFGLKENQPECPIQEAVPVPPPVAVIPSTSVHLRVRRRERAADRLSHVALAVHNATARGGCSAA
jgi:hypothetical protein